jgi:Ser/Thr protein kinase RdoA (MazF antagonist)
MILDAFKSKVGMGRMKDNRLNRQLHRLFKDLGLQDITAEPQSLQGGFLHQMMAVETLEGKYAIKVLNPKVMEASSTIENFVRSERIATIASAVIPALPSKVINGQSLHRVDGQFFQVFDLIEGQSKRPHEITLADCEKMGSLLATLHQIDFTEIALLKNPRTILSVNPWKDFLDLGQIEGVEWVRQLEEMVDKLYLWDDASRVAVETLSGHDVISHGDIDPKNVLWIDQQPVVIDWEFAGNVNPMQELVETAIYWAEDENHVLQKERVIAFVKAYVDVCGPLTADLQQIIIAGFSGKLSWLAYNLKRSLGTSGEDLEERQVGTEQVLEMLVRVRHYGERLEEIANWF